MDTMISHLHLHLEQFLLKKTGVLIQQLLHIKDRGTHTVKGTRDKGMAIKGTPS